MGGMFIGCNDLTQINVPLNVTVDVELPSDGTWTDTDENSYTTLPKNVTESFVINKTT